jgi:hypothetical protein
VILSYGQIAIISAMLDPNGVNTGMREPMYRTGLFSTFALLFASGPSFAQFGGMGGMGGGGGPGAAGTTIQGGGFVGHGFAEVRRSVQIEMEGGQRLSGKIDLRPVIVDGDLGRYTIMPDKIKMIRFLKPANEVEGDGDIEGGGGDGKPVVPARLQNRGLPARVVRVGRGGFGGTGDRDPRTGAALARGKVITITDQEIIGTIHIPADISLVLDFGALNLAPAKLRSITFTGANRQEKPAPAGAATLRTPEDVGQVAQLDAASPPRYFRHGNSLVVISSVGDRVMLFDIETKKSQSLELPGSKDAPLEVALVTGDNFVALTLRGSKITRIAVADTSSGLWHPQELRTPIEGRAVPIVGPGVVLYVLGRDVYAYGAQAQRWDVAELAEGVRATPVVAAGTITIEGQGHIYTFAGKSGKWEHVDVRAVLEAAGAEKK